MLAQIPVFLGLYHVLMSFNRTQTGFGRLGLSVEENRSLGNYFFSATDVGHFLDANLFGAPIGAAITQQHGLAAYTEFSRDEGMHLGLREPPDSHDRIGDAMNRVLRALQSRRADANRTMLR